MNQWVIMRTFANRFRSTTWCYHLTFCARCGRFHPSIVGGLQVTERLLETPVSVRPVGLLVPQRSVERLGLEQQAGPLGLAPVEPVELEQVALVKIAVAHTEMHRSVEQLVAIRKSKSGPVGQLHSSHLE